MIGMPSNQPLRWIALAITFAGAMPVLAWAQNAPMYNFYERSPYESVGLIEAQAQMIRAQAAAAVDYQIAREIAADAYDKELDNALKTVEIYFKRRAERDAHVLKNHLDEADKRRDKALRRIENNPELTGEGMSNGRALNTLKEALRESVLSFQYLEGDDPEVERLIAQFDLSLDIKSKIRLRLTNVRGETPIFSADSGRANTFDWWPFILRDEKFQPAREEIQRQLSEVQRASQLRTEIDNKTIEELENACLNLANQFLETYNRTDMAKEGIDKFRMYRAAETHLQSMMLAVQRLKNVGQADGALNIGAYDPNVDGKNLASLLAYMTRNGVEFAPPKPGDEAAYHKLFEMAKSLYVVSSRDDEDTL
ncbi:hypothetical protein LOC68_19495 [Blastopirellula sp. JC732]|uniref:Uncharacterized protein n=1 Tax=Blastopirellula sediminis TaxID=2894196 RepID=A0A9X1SLD3_9BACT|nr:hypothetical protein [Blastopirellula sediminis]MCC9606117.1 hypothetical protein [Blastopirellula sediminis]MCC9630584.1 hypothetical protein [Blastopirellula sediminis]